MYFLQMALILKKPCLVFLCFFALIMCTFTWLTYTLSCNAYPIPLLRSNLPTHSYMNFSWQLVCQSIFSIVDTILFFKSSISAWMSVRVFSFFIFLIVFVRKYLRAVCLDIIDVLECPVATWYNNYTEYACKCYAYNHESCPFSFLILFSCIGAL